MSATQYRDVFSESELRAIADEFGRLKDDHYLDNAGSGLYTESQIRDACKELSVNLYLNPHSSKHTDDCIEQIRYRILQHFNTNSKEYSVVFTSGTTASLKLAVESFNFKNPDADQGQLAIGTFAYLQDCHTSVLGLREIAAEKGARIKCMPHETFLQRPPKEFSDADGKVKNLLVYSAQCNFSGYKYHKDVATLIKHDGEKSNWYVLLDAACYAATNFLDLSKHGTDFVAVSFYKIFGYPTGLGALLVRNASAGVLSDKKYFGGGTVEIAISGTRFHKLRDSVSERLEDGTVPFLSILALRHGFDILNRLVPETSGVRTMERISEHVFRLASYLFHNLRKMRHSNGAPIVKLYSDSSYDNVNEQGGIVNFNILKADGSYVGFAEVEHMASIHNIHLRTGCFCNPGACQRHLKLTEEDLKNHHNAGRKCGDENDLINGVPTGSVRISFGYYSTKKDADVVLNMIRSCYITDSTEKEMAPEELSLQKLSLNNNELDLVRLEDCDVYLKAICVYPIKSCGAFKVEGEWTVGEKGLVYDREWMIVTSSGVAMTQKQNAKMCLIKPTINIEKEEMTLSYPGMSDHSISLRNEKSLTFPNSKEVSGDCRLQMCRSKVCGDSVDGSDCGLGVAEWLSDALQTPGLRLIRQNDAEKRTAKKNRENGQGAPPLSLVNQAQYLLINATSVEWLMNRSDLSAAGETLSNCLDRFRANLIVRTATPLEENNWKRVVIGGTALKVDGPCSRCQIICIDQTTGMKSSEPLRIIANEFHGKRTFGIYLSSEDDKMTIVDGASRNMYSKIKCGKLVTII